MGKNSLRASPFLPVIRILLPIPLADYLKSSPGRSVNATSRPFSRGGYA
jgi:hypothetical protein